LHHPNPYPFFKNAKLFVHTAKYEGLPTVLLESLALGTPVVSYDCPTGPRDILGKNSEYGELISLNDKDMFVEKVLELMNTTKNKHPGKDLKDQGISPETHLLFQFERPHSASSTKVY